MDFKDLLPLVGVALGWMLGEGSAIGKRRIERRRALGRAVALLYVLHLELVQIRALQRYGRSVIKDRTVWERQRKRSFDEYTIRDPDFFKNLGTAFDQVGEYYPIEAYTVRDTVHKYQFVKSRSLAVHLHSDAAYEKAADEYDEALTTFIKQVREVLLHLSFRQSKFTWFRIRQNLSSFKSVSQERLNDKLRQCASGPGQPDDVRLDQTKDGQSGA